MTFYARIIHQDDLNLTDKGIIDGEVTTHTGLSSIERPHNNGEGPYSERVRLTTTDGETEAVVGHFLGSGEEEMDDE